MLKDNDIFQYNPWEYTPPGETGQLLYLSIAVTTTCNFRCSFCSKAGQKPLHLDSNLLSSVLQEAITLGLTKVEFTGGEPLLYPGILDLVEDLKEKGIASLFDTNGSTINPSIASRLARAEAMVAVSLSALNAQRFDELTGTHGQYTRVLEAIHLLRQAGFSNKQAPLLAVQSVASRETVDEIPALREWAEANGCLFILNRPIPVGAMDNRSLISPHMLKELLGSRARVPFSLDSPCNRLAVGCYIGSDAVVRPCSCIDIPAGSLYEETLSSIWKNSPVMIENRNIFGRLQGSCKRCEENTRCYGCRAVAYAVFGDITAPDPGCFRFVDDGKSREEVL